MPRLAMSGAASAGAFGFNKLAQAINDAYFNLVSLLLPGNGTNGAQNNTFLDSSSNNFTITRNGNTTQGTFTPFSQTGWSNYFDGSTAYLTTAANAALAYGSSDVTFELFAYFPSNSSANSRLLGNWSGTWAANCWSLHSNHSTYVNKLSFWINNYSTSAALLVSTSNVPLNQWVHIAITRSGTTWRLFLNGVLEATQTSSVAIDGGATDDMYIGGTGSATEYSNSYLSNVRVTKGGALYTSAFTPSTAPLTTTVSVGTVSLLTCQANRFIDNSSNAIAITVNGTPSVQAFSPFAPTAAYSAATNGGSGYFDGTGDYLTVANNAAFQLGTGDFTIECWYYAQDISSVALFGLWGPSSSNASWLMYLDGSGNPVWYTSTNGSTQTASLTSSRAITLNAWNHIAISRVSGTTTVYVNGVSGGSTSTVISLFNATSVLTVGYNPIGGTPDYTVGYLSGIRVVKGSAAYTAAFTPPTAPLTAITNTSLLLNFTNGGIIDATGKNVLETVGNAQISTTQSKFGGSSMYFDGTGDYLVGPSNAFYNFGTGDFTIECWIRLSTVNAAKMIVSSNYNSSTGGGGWAFIYRGDISSLSMSVNSNVTYTKSWSPSADTWYHVAVCRSGTNMRLFVDGTQIGTTSTSSDNVSGASTIVVGGNLGGGANLTLDGYIDDLRITNYARYTANFTAPTAAFSLQ